MKVKLTYFKQSGKYYTDGEYDTNKEALYEIWDEVRSKQVAGELPGLIVGCTKFTILVEVPDHPHAHPHLIPGVFNE